MIFGVTAYSNAFSVAASSLWTPLNMSVPPGIYLDANDSSVTDVSGACSAISNIGSLGSVADFSQASASFRPSILVGELNGKRVLRFDGTDDVMLTSNASAKAVFNAVQTLWAVVVYKKRATDASPTSRGIFMSTIGTGTGSRFTPTCGFTTAGDQNKPSLMGRSLDANSQTNLVSTTALSGSYVMALYAFNTFARWGRIYINGSLDVENTTFSAGIYTTTSATDSQQNLSLGAFTSSGFSDIDLAAFVTGAMTAGQSLSSGDIDRLFGWAAHKWGLTASLPPAHPYKTSAPTV